MPSSHECWLLVVLKMNAGSPIYTPVQTNDVTTTPQEESPHKQNFMSYVLTVQPFIITAMTCLSLINIGL